MGTFFSSRNLEKSMIKAVYGNNTDFLKFLIQKGADVNSQSNNKIKSEILDISILSGKKNTPLIFASFYGNYEVAEVLIDNKAGILALIVLASKGNEKMCILYVRNGANPFLINGSGKSGYYFAREFGFAKKLVDAHNEFNGMRKK